MNSLVENTSVILLSFILKFTKKAKHIVFAEQYQIGWQKEKSSILWKSKNVTYTLLNSLHNVIVYRQLFNFYMSIICTKNITKP